MEESDYFISSDADEKSLKVTKTNRKYSIISSIMMVIIMCGYSTHLQTQIHKNKKLK